MGTALFAAAVAGRRQQMDVICHQHVGLDRTVVRGRKMNLTPLSLPLSPLGRLPGFADARLVRDRVDV